MDGAATSIYIAGSEFTLGWPRTLDRKEEDGYVRVFSRKIVRIMSRSIRDDNTEMGLINVDYVSSEPDRVMELCIGYCETSFSLLLLTCFCTSLQHIWVDYVTRQVCIYVINSSVLRFSQR
jgi:hypothetical protein